MSHKVTATNLANEYFFWKNRSGAYGDLKTDEDRLAWLVNRCERMISAEVIEHVNPFASVKPGLMMWTTEVKHQSPTGIQMGRNL
jgi:hypothetical protein